MPDASFVGRSFPAAEPYQVGREKVREFARAIGETAPVCHDVTAARAAGHSDVVAPPTFAAAFTMPLIEQLLRDPDFGWDYAHMVHGDQSITLHRPICGGDELTVTVHVEDLATRAGSHRLTLRCEIADPAGAAVATTKLLLVTAEAA
ncbi:FAS1-like dehydratase domain-containing protein [Pseudonocardia sp. CA-107938]|uniref:FAS1-like dehydratase domain-containing protein n=1 Tax=Pseudonocardia sp. CA-107938 TaxID=3240021 RepID=UPI003D9368E5